MLHQFKASMEASRSLVCNVYGLSSCRKEGSRVAEQQIPQSTLDPLLAHWFKNSYFVLFLEDLYYWHAENTRGQKYFWPLNELLLPHSLTPESIKNRFYSLSTNKHCKKEPWLLAGPTWYLLTFLVCQQPRNGEEGCLLVLLQFLASWHDHKSWWHSPKGKRFPIGFSFFPSFWSSILGFIVSPNHPLWLPFLQQ